MDIEMLPAEYGDCMLIELKTKDNKNTYTILVDGGTSKSYREGLKSILESYLVGDKKLDLVIITHSDDDHISGMNDILKNEKIVTKVNRVIYNSPYAIGKAINEWDEKDLTKTIKPKVIKRTKVSTGFNKSDKGKNKKCITDNSNTGAIQARNLQQNLYDLGKLEMNLILNDGKSDINDNGIIINFLSPTQELLNDFFHVYKSQKNSKKKNSVLSNTAKGESDYNIPFNILINDKTVKKLSTYNMASMAFIIYEEVSKQSILIMGDASYGVVGEKLRQLKDQNGILYSENNPIEIEYFKLSHHGSICDLTDEFLNLIKCQKFLISTSGKIFGHPDKKMIARVYSNFNNASFYFNYEERVEDITKEGGEIKSICEYKRRF